MKRILVIGATGMFGKPVAMQLQKDGYQIRVLGKPQITLNEWCQSQKEVSMSKVT